MKVKKKALVTSSSFSDVRQYSMRVLITVGSTRFDALVEAALSQPVLNALTQKGYSEVVIQCGNSQVDDAFSPTERERNVRMHGVNIDMWKFKPSLDEEYDAADLVIGHAGLRSPYSLLSLATTYPMTSGFVV
jgi:UDP-N-acetylglucosamine transferase subunit ALG13